MFSKPEPTVDELLHLIAGMNAEILRLSEELVKAEQDAEEWRQCYLDASEVFGE